VIYKSLLKTSEKQTSKCDERRDLRKMKRKEKGLAKHHLYLQGVEALAGASRWKSRTRD